jgi:hypothetical protein
MGTAAFSVYSATKAAVRNFARVAGEARGECQGPRAEGGQAVRANDRIHREPIRKAERALRRYRASIQPASLSRCPRQAPPLRVPSIDRRSSSGGYTKDDVRLVCVAVTGPRQSSSALRIVATRKRLCHPVRMLARQRESELGR